MARARQSAGLLMYRMAEGNPQVLLAHPGGPLFRHKDDGAWSIPKGEIEADEDLLAAAQREFAEETGVVPAGPFIPLHPVKQRGGKTVFAWACQGNCQPNEIRSNKFSLEWPPHSGQQTEFPEIDRAEFFDLTSARIKINAAQVAFLDQLAEILNQAS